MCRVMIIAAALAALVNRSPADDKEAAAKKAAEQLQGTWDMTAYVVAGVKSDRIKGAKVVIEADKLRVVGMTDQSFFPLPAVENRVRLDPSCEPKAFDVLTADGKPTTGGNAAYRLDRTGRELILSFALDEGPPPGTFRYDSIPLLMRPTKFEGKDVITLTLTRTAEKK